MNHLLLITGFYMRMIDLIRHKVLDMLLLIRKDVGLVLVTKVIIDHAPDGCFTRAGLFCNNLNGMLTVKDIV